MNLAINEKSEKFWYGVSNEVWVVWGSVGEVVGSECGEVSGEVWRSVRSV